jgi:hypothetical protein
MQPLWPAHTPPEEIERACDAMREDFERRPEMYIALGITDAASLHSYARERISGQQVWMNDTYTVAVYTDDRHLTHLSIKRNDRKPVRDWRDMQAIKNQLCGPEREACELYPAESRLVDSANQFHLWVLPAGMQFPFGFTVRLVTNDPGVGGAVQRPRPDLDVDA